MEVRGRRADVPEGFGRLLVEEYFPPASTFCIFTMPMYVTTAKPMEKIRNAPVILVPRDSLLIIAIPHCNMAFPPRTYI